MASRLTASPSITEAAGSRTWKGAISLAFLAFPLFLSVDLENVSPSLDTVLNAWKMLSALIVALLYINRLIARKPARAHILALVAVMSILLFSTVANSGSLERYVIVWGGFFAVALLVEVRIRENPMQLLLALKIVLGVLTLLNFATVIAFPEGLWSSGKDGYWLLGHRNNFGAPLIAAIVVSAAHDLLARRRLAVSTFLIAAASFLSVALTWSASSVLTIVLTIAALLLVTLSRRGLVMLRPWVLLGVYVATAVGIVVLNAQELASDFIENVLDRSTDLTGRTRIWEIVFGMIGESPFIGHGVQLSENNGLTIYNSNFVHAHNGELDILMQGGWLTFIPFAVMIICATRSAMRSYHHRVIQILYIGLVLAMFRAITGLFFSSYTVLILFLLLNSDVIARFAADLVPAHSLLVQPRTRKPWRASAPRPRPIIRRPPGVGGLRDAGRHQ